MLSGDGVVNNLLMALHITKGPILFFQKGPYFWWIIAFANTWRGMGYNAIIYLASAEMQNADIWVCRKF